MFMYTLAKNDIQFTLTKYRICLSVPYIFYNGGIYCTSEKEIPPLTMILSQGSIQHS